MELADIKKCVQLLVRDGIDSESILAALPSAEFSTEYLKNIGITSLGARQQLLIIHQSLVEQHRTSASKSTHLPTKKVLILYRMLLLLKLLSSVIISFPLTIE